MTAVTCPVCQTYSFSYSFIQSACHVLSTGDTATYKIVKIPALWSWHARERGGRGEGRGQHNQANGTRLSGGGKN